MAAGLRTLGAVAVVTSLIGGAASLQAMREARFPAPPPGEDSLYLTSGTTVRRLTAGYTALAADLYWIRAIQYYGGVKLRLQHAAATRPQPDAPPPSDYALLYPMLDLTTTLDPRFNIAYRFGAIFLAEPWPGGAGRPDLAIRLLEKGLAARPDKWEYMQDIGFVHYWWRHDYKEAAAWFDRASKVQGAPWFLRSLAATTLAEGGDRQSSRTMWEAIGQSAEIDWLRNDAERRLMQLDAADFIEQMQADVDRARAAGLPVTSWQELIRAGAVRGVPVDPMRVPFELDASGTVRLSPQSPLFPLPDEPKGPFPLPRP
ncbi:MAG TPA: hypothetical protein VM032_15690 [Vicinamibacterales bacterium]|nr:hypothetical protein [Vicinamibacterales bacterium]